MIETLAWLGGLALAICAVPQAWMSWRQKHSDGISNGMIGLWLFGEICLMVVFTYKLDWPLIINYGVNLIVIAVIAYYKYFPHDRSIT